MVEKLQPLRYLIAHLISLVGDFFSYIKEYNICLTKQNIEFISSIIMKVRCSLKTAKTRDKDCKLVRRKGRIYVINKKNPRMKARQG